MHLYAPKIIDIMLFLKKYKNLQKYAKNKLQI